MTSESFLFYIFSSIALISGGMVIRSKNPVHSVLFLILVFCNAAGLLILLNLDFFAMIFLIVYVGAIAVLFLFVVMMLNIKLTEINENILRYLPVGGLIGLIFLFEILLVIDNDFVPLLPSLGSIAPQSIWPFHGSLHLSHIMSRETVELTDLIDTATSHLSFFNSLLYTEWPTQINRITNIEALGLVLYTYFFYFFIIASLILLVAMIGAIVLTMHKGLNIKRQEIFEQNSREFAKTIRKFRD
jgi:NADH-ubiquinone oxidoreductase chain 6